MSRLIFTACIAAVISGGMVSQAFAGNRIVIETGVIRISDLNLATEQGARTLVRRVAAKAGDLCAQADSPLVRDVEKARRTCVAKAVAKSVAGLDAPMVTAEYTRLYPEAATLVAAR
jgi:UrcA family protein